MNLSEMAGFLSSGKDKKEGETKKASVNVIEAGSLEEAVAKAREMAEKLGLPVEEIEKISDKLAEAIAESEQAKTKKFGIYNHAALAGLGTAAEADRILNEINARATADPEATTQLKLRDALEAVNMFRKGYLGSQQAGSSELCRVAETGILMMMWAVGLSKVPPEELFKRLATMWTGAGPGELEFRPVFDEDYPAILSAWLEYKEGRIDQKEFLKRCGQVRSITGHDSEAQCNCEECTAERGKK